MNSKDMVTDFAIGEKKERKTVRELIKALNDYLKSADIEADEYNFTVAGPLTPDGDPKIPERFRWLVAFKVEGESEGYYVHVGAMEQTHITETFRRYHDFGFCKTFSAENAQVIATEAQRFLNAVMWN